jgi:CHAT domain-containing protein/Tfp pilus assembly protein PilF
MLKYAIAGVLLLLASLGAAAQGPELTDEQRALMKEADRHSARATKWYQQRKVPEATAELRKSVELLRQAFPSDRYPQGNLYLAGALNNLAFVLNEQGEHTQAEPLLREALTMARPLYPKKTHPHGHARLVDCLTHLGTVCRAMGEYDRAEPVFREALTMAQGLFPRATYPRGEPSLAFALHNLGTVLQDQGEFARAEPLLQESLQMYQALYPSAEHPKGHHFVAASLNNLGKLFWDQGEYRKAEPLYRQALAMLQRLYPTDTHPRGEPDLASTLSGLGSVLQAQQEYKQAEPFLRDALAMRRRLYPKEQFPTGHPDLANSLINLAGLFEDRGELERAEPLFREALAMYQARYPENSYPQGHPRLALSLHNLGFALHYQGKSDEAEPILRRALAMRRAYFAPPRYPQGHNLLVDSLTSLAVLLHDRGEHAQAEPFASEALTMRTALATRLAQVVPEPVALNAAATFPRLRDGLLSVTRTIADSDGRSYAAVWHSRAALTRVYQRRHLALIAAATDPAVRRAWDALQVLRRQREQLIMAPAAKDTGERARKLDRLGQEIDTAERELLPLLPVLKHAEDLARLGPDALRRILPANAVLIDLLRYTLFERDPNITGSKGEKHTSSYVAFVVSRQEVRRVELGRAADIEPAVRAWRETIIAAVPGSEAARREYTARLARQAGALRRLLWAPIEQRLPAGVAAIYLTPDAELTQLPWAALPGKTPDRVLLEDYAVAVLPHGPFLLEQLTPPPARSTKRPPAPDGLLLVGGIRYDDQPAAANVAMRGAEEVVEQKVVWGYLPGTEAERQSVARLLEKSGPKLTANLGGIDAATARLRQELERCRYPHIATHGFFADSKFRSVLQLDDNLFNRRLSSGGGILERRGAGARSPLVLCGLVCAGANRTDTLERGILSGDAIAGLLLDDLHLAVLSACDTGLGDVAGGEGVFGLQRAFHIAGCQNVVASLWKVPDRPTAALMALFYQNLWGKKLPPIAALRQAQLEIYRHPERIGTLTADLRGTFKEVAGSGAEMPAGAGSTAHPRLWAAFTLSGAGR